MKNNSHLLLRRDRFHGRGSRGWRGRIFVFCCCSFRSDRSSGSRRSCGSCRGRRLDRRPLLRVAAAAAASSKCRRGFPGRFVRHKRRLFPLLRRRGRRPRPRPRPRPPRPPARRVGSVGVAKGDRLLLRRRRSPPAGSSGRRLTLVTERRRRGGRGVAERLLRRRRRLGGVVRGDGRVVPHLGDGHGELPSGGVVVPRRSGRVLSEVVVVMMKENKRTSVSSFASLLLFFLLRLPLRVLRGRLPDRRRGPASQGRELRQQGPGAGHR